MTFPYEPDSTVHPSAHLREFLEIWRDQPARAIVCASVSRITLERAQELIDGSGEPWSLVEAADMGMIMGPNITFWQQLIKNHRIAVAQGKEIIR